MTDTTPDWLVLAENEYAEEERARWAEYDAVAANIAEVINVRLEELGITPLTPADTDGKGHLIPAQLIQWDPEKRLHGVYATYDEECKEVKLLATKPGLDHTHGVKEAGRMTRGISAAEARRLIVHARHKGAGPEPYVPPQPSVDAKAIVGALDEVRAAMENLARSVGRP